MIIQIQWEFDLGLDDHPDYMELHNKFAEDNGVPLVVDLKDYFEDMDTVTLFQVTDALSDEHGWLVQDWWAIDSCN